MTKKKSPMPKHDQEGSPADPWSSQTPTVSNGIAEPTAYSPLDITGFLSPSPTSETKTDPGDITDSQSSPEVSNGRRASVLEVQTPSAFLSLLNQRKNIDEDEDAETGATQSVGISDISFAVCRFVCTEFMMTKRQEDVKFLEDKGCLRVPCREIMDEMVSQFFRHIQPLLPIFDESSFWSQYRQSVKSQDQSNKRSHSNKRMSLFLLQAMLFASCSFLTAPKLVSLGFRTIRHARKCLYHRARLLYCLETEKDPLTLAQGCLLLTLWSPRDDDKQTDTWWLTNAVHYARTAQVHHNRRPDRPQSADELALKRTWWACIVRDRIMSLGLHRPVLITRDIFDFETHSLTVDDIIGDPAGPSVHDSRLRRVITILTTSLCELCALLTDIPSLVNASKATFRASAEYRGQFSSSVQCIRESIQTWHCDLAHRLSAISKSCRSNHSVILYSNLLRMYYQ
jgi:hypothetical protein